eukprot:991157-Amphidinium_carterae.2
MDDFAGSKDLAEESEAADSVEESISEHSDGDDYSDDFQEATGEGESSMRSHSRRLDKSVASMMEDIGSASASALEALREEDESAERRQEEEAQMRARVEGRRQMLAAAKAEPAGGQPGPSQPTTTPAP